MSNTTNSLSKTVDQVCTTSTLTDDNDFQFYVGENRNYQVTIIMGVSVSGVLPAYSWTITGPASPKLVLISGESLVPGGLAYVAVANTAYNVPNNITSLNSKLILKINIILQNGPNEGLFIYKFARPSGTSVTNLAGSSLVYTYDAG